MLDISREAGLVADAYSTLVTSESVLSSAEVDSAMLQHRLLCEEQSREQPGQSERTLPEHFLEVEKIDIPKGAEFDVHIQRSSSQEKLGIIVKKYNREANEVEVVSVKGGLIDDWNRKNSDARVQPGDFLLEVNGDRQFTAKCAKQMVQGVEDLQLRFRRS